MIHKDHKGSMMQKRNETQDKQRKSGLGLKPKLMLRFSILIFLISSLTLLVFGLFIERFLEKSLIESLKERISLTMDSVSLGAKICSLNDDLSSFTEIINHPSESNEIISVTITGKDANGFGLNTLYATTEKDILENKDAPFIAGKTLLSEKRFEGIFHSFEELNQKAKIQTGSLTRSIRLLEAEKKNTEDENLKKHLQKNIDRLLLQVDTTLNKISLEEEGSVPEFDTERINKKNTDYIFYKPVLYLREGNDNLIHGVIFIHVDTRTLKDQMQKSHRKILIVFVSVLVIALILSLALIYMMTSFITYPIKKLVAHMKMIVNTEDKEKLKGKSLIIKSRDEIGLLCDSMNEMAKGLVEAAIQNKNLSTGKYIQNKFIPLEIKDGIIQTTGAIIGNGAELFSYYIGADDLSGDYFDYKQLDDKHCAIIKCDVSGHGIPAALIMIEVATLFSSNFKNWNMKKKSQGLNIVPVVEQINDFLESRRTEGRFAAFSLCIMNTESGECWFCNAGDNLVHIYDGEAKKKKIITLEEAPAAGIFSTELPEMKGKYKVSKIMLKKNDVLFLFTDGIEESKRNFRNEESKIIPCKVSGLRENEEHENHRIGECCEELSLQRMKDIIESVYRKKRYTLHKFHAPQKESDFTFDFSSCSGTAEEAVMALVSVEKVFRMYKTLKSTLQGRVKVDKKIDTFLKKHFDQYQKYCSNCEEIKEDPLHVYYRGVGEDTLLDDLTVIAIKKN